MVLKKPRNSTLYFLCFFLLAVSATAATRKGIIDWRVESDLKKLERIPSYAGEKSPFPYRKEPVKRVKVVKKETSKELTESQQRALRAADILSDIRNILNDSDIFNADVSEISVNGIIKSKGKRTALIKNRWYKAGDVIDVPIVAKENLQELVETLRSLDESLAEVVESQVDEKIEAVHNLSLSISEINADAVHLLDDDGLVHVINFKRRTF